MQLSDRQQGGESAQVGYLKCTQTLLTAVGPRDQTGRKTSPCGYSCTVLIFYEVHILPFKKPGDREKCRASA